MIDLYSSTYQVLSTIIIFLLGGLIALLVRRNFYASLSRALLIYVWHTLFCGVYFYYVINNGGDAISYYSSAGYSDLSMSFGTGAVRLGTAFLRDALGLSFLGCFFVFQIFGFLGLLGFDASLRSAVQNKPKMFRFLASLIVFLPSVSFWSSAIGKDAISFLSVGLALWGALDMRRRWALIVVSVLFMLIVRPHMAGLLGVALAISFVLKREMPILYRLSFFSAAFLAALVLVPAGLGYAGLSGDSSIKDIEEYIETRQGYNRDGGGAVDISGMSLPAQMATYLFRPTVFEVRDFLSMAAAVDNLIIFMLFLMGAVSLMRRGWRIDSGGNAVFLLLYSFMAWVLLAMTTANLGIALRQKWMFVPMLIFLLLSVLGREKERDL